MTELAANTYVTSQIVGGIVALCVMIICLIDFFTREK